MRSIFRLCGALVAPSLLIGGVGLIAIGLSGGVAGLLAAAFGTSFVTGNLPDIQYTAGRCAELFQLAPGTPSCGAASVAHHMDEVLQQRLAAGVLGLVAMCVWLLVGRRKSDRRTELLPRGFVSAVGATLFGVAGVILLGDVVDRMTQGTAYGGGQFLSGASASLALAAVFARFLWRNLRGSFGFAARTSLPNVAADKS